MKRSTKIGLGAAGVVLVASAWSLMGGEDDHYVYADPAACRADGKLTHDQCEQRFQEARAAHTRNARRFGSQTNCEAEYGPGKCETTNAGGGQQWVPALVGFMVARNLAASGGGIPQPLLPPTRQTCPPGNTIPECQPPRSGSSGGSSSGGRWYSTPSGGTVSTSKGSGSTSVGVTSRGGFGSTGRGGGFSSGS